MSLKFRPGSVYYNREKDFYLLVTERTNDLIIGYTSRYGKPSSKDLFNGLNRELVGVMDFGDFRIGFGNKFRKSVISMIPEEYDVFSRMNKDYKFIRNLEKLEYRVFKMMLLLRGSGLVTRDEYPEMGLEFMDDIDAYEHNPYKITDDRLYIST